MNLFSENTGISFQKMQHSDIEQTATCISQVFSSFEPIAKALKISFDAFYRFAIPVCQKAADEEISLIAKDPKTREVVGFIISEDLMNVYPDSVEGIDNKFESVFSLLSELEENYRKCHLVKAGQILHILMLGVQEKYSNRHIATTLVRENLNLAKHHNFEIAIAEATGVASGQIFRNLGFIEEFAIEYKSYKFKNKHIFSSIENPPNCLLMSRCLKDLPIENTARSNS
jgi:ribosomal protein S18 acetylase RimI-like enzyme